MISLLGLTFFETFGLIVLLGVTIGLLYFMIWAKSGEKFRKKIGNKFKKKKEPKLSEIPSVVLSEKFMVKQEVDFYNFLSKCLPPHYMLIPHVGVDQLVKPFGNKNLYNSLMSKYVDFCLFDKDNEMKALLVIDIKSQGYSEKIIATQDPAVSLALKTVGIPVLELETQDFYLADEILPLIKSKIDKEKNEEKKLGGDNE